MAADFSTGLSAGASAALGGFGEPEIRNIDALAHRPLGDGGDKIAAAARDFEALLLGQILRSVHDEGGWLGTGDDDAGSAAIGLGEEQLARTLAASGGLGLSRMIESGLRSRQIATTPATAAWDEGD